MTEAQQIALSAMAYRGDAIAWVDKTVYFVAGGIPGEEVQVQVVQQRRRHTEARVTGVLTPSPHRVEPPCPYFGTCGGCQWQHIDYRAQLDYKRKLVQEQLARRGDFADPPVRTPLGMENPWHYRNQARFTVDSYGRLGFTERFTSTFLPIDACLIMHSKINEVLTMVQARCRVRHQLVVRYGIHTGELMVFPEVPLNDLPFQTGQAYYHEALSGYRFRIFNASFFQTNTLQAETLARVVRDQLALTGTETVVDAYCGVGTFGVLIAEQAGHVIGIEESATAIADAQYNTRDFDHIELITAKTEHALPELNRPVDAVILDPPRVGCRPEVIGALLHLRPAKIVYVSCDPYPLARDLRLLVHGGYELLEIQPVDMFPHTYHIETVSTLVLA